MQGGNEKFSYILRTVAGAYLCYLSYSILRAVMNGETGGTAYWCQFAQSLLS